MAGTTPLFEKAQRDRVEKGLQNEAITDHPLLFYMMKSRRISFGRDINNVQIEIHPRHDSTPLDTWGRMTPSTAAEKEVTITASYTDGAYAKNTALSALDRRKFKANENEVYVKSREDLRILLDAAKDRFHEQLRVGTGVAGASGEGESIVGMNTVVPLVPAGASYATIPFTGNEDFWQPQVIDGDLGPSTDFDLDRYNRISKVISDTTLRQDGRVWRPNIGFISADLMLTLREEWFDRGQENPNNSGIKAHLGANQDSIWIDGVEFFIDENVRTDTVECFNTGSMELRFMDDRMWVMEEKPDFSKYGTPTVLEITNGVVFIVTRPRLNGIVKNANAA